MTRGNAARVMTEMGASRSQSAVGNYTSGTHRPPHLSSHTPVLRALLRGADLADRLTGVLDDTFVAPE